MESQNTWQQTADQLRFRAKLKPILKDTLLASVIILGVFAVAIFLVPAA